MSSNYSNTKYQDLIRTQNEKNKEKNLVKRGEMEKTRAGLDGSSKAAASSTKKGTERGAVDFGFPEDEEILESLLLNERYIDPSEKHNCVPDPIQTLKITSQSVRQIEEISLAKKEITALHPNFLLFENLQTLDVRRNNLTTLFNLLPSASGAGTQKNLTGPKGCLRLRRLYLSFNSIRDLSLTDIPRLLTLEELYMDNNDLVDQDKIAHHLRKLKSLKVLDLRDNPCATEHRYRVSVVGKLKNLERLDRVMVTEEERSAVRRADAEPAGPAKVKNESVSNTLNANNSTRDFSKSTTAALLETRRNKYIKTLQEQEEETLRLAKQREDDLRKEREGFHKLWTYSDEREGSSAPLQTRVSARGKPTPPSSASMERMSAAKNTAAAEVTRTVGNPEQESYIHAALVGRQDLVKERTGALPWADSLPPPSRRLADIHNGTTAVRAVTEDTNVAENQSDLVNRIKVGQQALIPPPWEGGDSSLNVTAGDAEVQNRVVEVLDILLLPEEAKAMEAAYGACEVLQVLALRRANKAAQGAVTSEPSSPKSTTKRPGSKRNKQGNQNSQQQQQLAFNVESILQSNTLLGLVREPLRMKPPKAERGAAMENAGTSAGAQTPVGFVGVYGKNTVDRFLSLCQKDSGAWDLPSQSLLNALVSFHKVENEINYNAVASSKRSVASHESRMVSVDESNSESKNSRTSRTKTKRQTEAQPAGGGGGPATETVSDVKAYLTVNNILGALAFYIPFVKSRYDFFSSRCTAAVNGDGANAKDWFSRKQACLQHLDNLERNIENAADREKMIVPYNSLVQRKVTTVGSLFTGKG